MPSPPSVRREVEKVGDVRLVRWHGSITTHTEVLDRADFGAWIDAGERRFVFNLATVTRMNSFAIGALVACLKRARSHRATIKLVLSRQQIELFELLRLDSVFQLYEREDEALGDFARNRNGAGA